jgi:hypothetical protein
MSWTAEHSELQALLRTYAGSGTWLVTKDSWFWRGLAWVLYVISFGGMRRERFLEDFATTVGGVVACPRSWTRSQVVGLLVHEARHVRQARWFGLGIPWVGHWLGLPLYSICYALLPLPVGIALLRVLFEADAEAVSLSWRLRVEPGFTELMAIRRMEHFAATVGSAAYFWPLPSSWVRSIFLWTLKRRTDKE